MKYVCQVCGYIYDEGKEGIPFADLPGDWRCPWCKASKDNFQPEAGGPAPRPVVTAAAPAPIGDAGSAMPKGWSAGQLAALCSNLARGCEKQYKGREQAWFQELADYFAAKAPAAADDSVERLAAELLTDVEQYPAVRRTADDAGDRGAARICVWGEKVTRMLASLVQRYRQEGEAMLEETDVWVCSVCGFVYIGEAPPERCPVCKVPDWKFDKIEGRSAQ